jgi:hypothetical protein
VSPPFGFFPLPPRRSDKRLQPLEYVASVPRGHFREHTLQTFDLERMQFPHQGFPRSCEVQRIDPPIRWIVPTGDEVLLCQAVDDLGNGWEGDIIGFGHLTYDAAWMLLGIKEDLRLGERQFELSRLSPEDLPKGRTKKRVQELQQALRVS